MIKRVSAILLLLGLSVVGAQPQQPQPEPLSDGDKSQIIESVLDLELRTQGLLPDFTNIRKVSSDNIEFVEPSKVSKLGFTLVAASYLTELKTVGVVEYLRFRKIFWRDDVAVVVLSRVTEGRPCFGAAFSRERSYTYESRRTSSGWIAQLVAKPTPQIVFAAKRLASKR
jgi:hypothetical protein